MDYDPAMGHVSQNWKKHDCLHNTKELHYGASILHGYSGDVHHKVLSSLKGLNVFLDAFMLPRLYGYANFQAGLSAELPKQRIIFFPIVDRSVPDAKGEFALMLQILEKELQTDGGEVNVSCIGGHGRTGLVLAILHGKLTGSKTPIEDIRAQYCPRAVESYGQEMFIHEWLGLPKPIEIIKPCSRCKKNDQELKPNGERDSWCAPCNRVFEEQQRQYKTQGQNSTLPFKANISTAVSGLQGQVKNGKSGAKCRKCWVREPQPDAPWCLTCMFSLSEKDLPSEKPAEMSKNGWKRILRAVTGSAHSPAPTVAAEPLKQPLGNDIHTFTAEERVRYAYLNEKPMLQMTEDEWAEWLHLKYGRTK